MINKIRGFKDWIDLDARNFSLVTTQIKKIAESYGYSEIQTPILEPRELFVRTTGETSDIVKKEFYDFFDKGDRHVVLRPEGTASVIRAVIEEKLLDKKPLPLKYYYLGPMFRYERPQSGRLRQFHQFGVEFIGSNSVYDDAETLILANHLLSSLNLKNYTININNIGSLTSRTKWIESLKKYFSQFVDQLSEDSKNRLSSNPLRILDDKVDGLKDFVKNAPKAKEFLTKEEISYFNQLVEILKNNKINFVINDQLVRGLDYYSNFVFEITSNDQRLKGQPTICGGGRYSHLVKELGGKDTNCVGFALGIERLLMCLEFENIQIKNQNPIEVVFATLNEESINIAFSLANQLRSHGVGCFINHNEHKINKHFKLAELYQPKYVVIIGDQEIKNETVLIKNQITLKQEEIKQNELINYVRSK